LASTERLERIWVEVDRLVDRAPRVDDLIAHKLHLFAARRWHAEARTVPASIVAAQRASALSLLATQPLLERIRRAHDGPLIVFKGPEVAARYPDPLVRFYSDIDLLAAEPAAAHADLIAAGAVPVGDPELYVDIHHLRPLAWSDVPLAVEIHTTPKWVDGLPVPAVADIFAAAVDAKVGADGYLAPAPAQHAVLLAAHSWAHEPFRCLRDLVDVAVIASEVSPLETKNVAQHWEAGDLWRATEEVMDALFVGGAQPLALRTWAKNLSHVRGRTVLEEHLERWASDFWVLPRRTALRRLPATALREVTPRPGEKWSDKLRRSALAIRNAARRRMDHDDALGDASRR
jgi:Uncharacterised nucleotidyltransferase